MATVKIVLIKDRQSSKIINEVLHHPIAIRVIHNRKVRNISLKKHILPDQWNDVAMKVIKHKLSRYINAFLIQKFNEVYRIVIELETNKPGFTVEDVVRRFKGLDSNRIYFKPYVEKLISGMRSAGRHGNATIYQTMLNRVIDFYPQELNFSDINYKWLKSFEQWNLANSVTQNSISIYLRTLRAVLNNAIKEELIPETEYAFKNFKIRSTKTKKRAISFEDIIAIRDCVTKTKGEIDAQNYFMFSFYCIGMSFHDIAHLKYENVENGRLFYKRVKTGKEYSILIVTEIQAILDYYTTNKKQEFVFPIITFKDAEKVITQIKSKLKIYNKNLRKLAERAGVKGHITSYVARHSWATIAKFSGVNISVISEGLGHDNVQTTETYLASIAAIEVDKANVIVIRGGK